MKKLYLFLFTAGIWLFLGVSYAMAAGSGGFRSEITDAGAMGMGSAFVGEADTPVAVYYNPAGTTQIKQDTDSEGLAFVNPHAAYKSPSGESTNMPKDDAYIPHGYTVIPIGKKWDLGFGAGTYWGSSSDWGPNSFARYETTKSELDNEDTMLTAAYKATDQWSLGASVDNDYSRVNLSNNLFQGTLGDDAHSQLIGTDDAWGYRLATLFKFNDQNQAGLMYRSAIYHRYVGTLSLDNLDPSAPYGLYDTFGGSSYETKVIEKSVYPQSIVMGYSFKPVKKLTLNLDLEWFDWSKYKEQLLIYPAATGFAQQALSQGNPTLENWHSSISEAIGAQYELTDRFRLRAGFFHQPQVVPDTTFDPSTLDSACYGLTTGFGYSFNKHLSVDLAYVGIIYQPRKVSNTVGTDATQTTGTPTPVGDISGRYTEFTNLVMMTLTYKF